MASTIPASVMASVFRLVAQECRAGRAAEAIEHLDAIAMWAQCPRELMMYLDVAALNGRLADKAADLAEQEERRYRAMAVQETMAE